LQDQLRVVLVAPRNPLNIGAAARAMSNFGFRSLRLVKPYEPAFHEARSAVRARYILDEAQVFGTLSEAIADCDLVVGSTALGHRDLHIPLHRLETAASALRSRPEPSSTALLFGSEKFGLSNEDLSYCHWALRIPTREEHGSMNLGQAVSICLYELVRSETAAQAPLPASRYAAAEEVERFTALLLELLHESGYVGQTTSSSSELKIRRLIRRLPLPSGDTETWLGILRQILWKVKRTRES
jgi:TrmH family RNA methyltransferase